MRAHVGVSTQESNSKQLVTMGLPTTWTSLYYHPLVSLDTWMNDKFNQRKKGQWIDLDMD